MEALKKVTENSRKCIQKLIYLLSFMMKKKLEVYFQKEKIKFVPGIAQNIYKIFKNQRLCLPFYDRWLESIDLSEYDVVIASNDAFGSWAFTGNLKQNLLCITILQQDICGIGRMNIKEKLDGIKESNFFCLKLDVKKKLRMWDYQAKLKTWCYSGKFK